MAECVRCEVNPGKPRNSGLCDGCFVITANELSTVIRFRIWKRIKEKKKKS